MAKPETIVALEQALTNKLGNGYLGESVFNYWRGNAHTLAELDRNVADFNRDAAK